MKHLKKILLIIFVLIVGMYAYNEVYHNKVIVNNIALENSQSTYTKFQIITPKKSVFSKEKLSLVTLGHGFKGTMNSGSANELAYKLAELGIATIRMDYNHYADEKCTEKTNEYTLSSMAYDQELGIKYMVDNYNIDKNKIGLYARSMGGRVAMTMANKKVGGIDYGAMVLVAPAGNAKAMRYYMGGDEKWSKMKAEALKKGFVNHQGLRLRNKWFEEFDDYDPSKDGSKFTKEVLVICNDLDYVVTAETSKECGKAYKNSRVIEVSTKDGHGYEMGYDNSKLKDELFKEITLHFRKTLLE